MFHLTLQDPETIDLLAFAYVHSFSCHPPPDHTAHTPKDHTCVLQNIIICSPYGSWAPQFCICRLWALLILLPQCSQVSQGHACGLYVLMVLSLNSRVPDIYIAWCNIYYHPSGPESYSLWEMVTFDFITLETAELEKKSSLVFFPQYILKRVNSFHHLWAISVSFMMITTNGFPLYIKII